MKLSALLDHFEVRTQAPVAIEEVRAQVILQGSVDRIQFYPVRADTGLYQGHLARYRMRPSPYEAEIECCDIYFVETLSQAHVRLAVCKELLHILDPEPWRIDTEAEVRHLLERIVLSPDLQTAEDIMADGPKVSWDRLNGLVAAAVLCPSATRDLLAPKFHEGKLGLGEIVALLQVPAEYVQLLMTESWPRVYSRIRELAKTVP